MPRIVKIKSLSEEKHYRLSLDKVIKDWENNIMLGKLFIIYL